MRDTYVNAYGFTSTTGTLEQAKKAYDLACYDCAWNIVNKIVRVAAEKGWKLV